MIGVYFSGTGNTKYCIEKFLSLYDDTAKTIALEDASVTNEIIQQSDIVLAYPIYYSNLPKIVRDFIVNNSRIWNGKRIFIISTMGLFSGDGAGLAARLLKKYGAQIIGGLHIKMPDCICDIKALKRSVQENRHIIERADKKIASGASKLREGIPSKDGLSFLHHIAGLFGQRLWFYTKTLHYSNKLKINKESCISCRNCISVCPMQNISFDNTKVIAGHQCTMCYRCINQCPKQAITLLGTTVYSQHRIDG